MKKSERVIYTRGGRAETPNWTFSLKASIPRSDLPDFCRGLDFIARERKGGAYYYPDYKNSRMAAAFEWYTRYRQRPFGFKVGVEFWVTDSDLEQLGVYVLYGPDHPRKGSPPQFTAQQQRAFQDHLIETLTLAGRWRTQLPMRTYHTIHYLKLPQAVVRRSVQIGSLKANILPTVVIRKDAARVSAVIHTVQARLRGEAEELAVKYFLQLCALLTLATGIYYGPYRSTLRRGFSKRFLHHVSPRPRLAQVYPGGRYTRPIEGEPELSLEALRLAGNQYCSVDPKSRPRFDDSLFAYYTAQDLIARRFPTLATVSLIAALKCFRRRERCDGSITCTKCGPLPSQHDIVGEAASIGNSLCDAFGLAEGDGRRDMVRKLVREVYKSQRSTYVHDALHRHDEFGQNSLPYLPSESRAISKQLLARNQLSTLDLLTRRALLHELARLARRQFQPGAYGIEADKYERTLGSFAHFVVGSKYFTGIRAMGRF